MPVGPSASPLRRLLLFPVLAAALGLVGLAQLILNPRILPPIPRPITKCLSGLPRLPEVFDLDEFGLSALAAIVSATLLFAVWARLLGAHRRVLALATREHPPCLPALTSRTGLALLIGGLCAYLVTLSQTLAAERPPAAWAWLAVVGTCLVLGWLADHRNGARPLAEQGANLAFLAVGAALLVAVALTITGQPAAAVAAGTLAGGVGVVVWRRLRHRWTNLERQERLILLALMVAQVALVGYGLDSWRWLIREDEGCRLDLARLMFSQPSAWALTGTGVSTYHTAQEVLPFAVTSRLFGTGIVGFRLANPLLLGLTLPFWHYCFRRVVGVRTALVATALLSSAHMLQCFGKIGYSNLVTLPWLGLTLAFATWAASSGRWLPVSLLGVALGEGFFLYGTARLFGPILAVWMLAHLAPTSRRRIAVWSFVVVSSVAVATPMLLNFEFWSAIRETSPFASEIEPGDVLRGTLHRAAVSPLLFIHNVWHTHFVQCADTDPLTGSAVVLGLGVWLTASRRRARQALAWLGMYIATCVLVGGFQNHDYPSNTRMFILLPFWTLAGAVGLDSLARGLIPGSGQRRHAGRRLLLGGACLVAGIANTWICLGPSQWLPMDGALGDRGLLMLMVERTKGLGHELLVVECPEVSPHFAREALAAVDVPPEKYAFVKPDDLASALAEHTHRPATVLLIRCPELADQVRSTVAAQWPAAMERAYAHFHDGTPMLCFSNRPGSGPLPPVAGYWSEGEARPVGGVYEPSARP
ncbi:MAG: hypothetical protein KA072_05585 [Thermoanaerobaculaceae bacterium]|nr:hypothetical protein [Thermoanaerobaculaceae bacterium]MDI9622288.1 hypothetical protein [Acidobacteriota bacterium]NLH10103.1 glycosyltransferase family 39 protein [Holophagae bacterium]HPW55043.1 hypothetical protein [Thermoanaerobaculaceae bacterium]